MTQPLAIPESCVLALNAVEANPLEPGPETEVHLRSCPACSEARVAFLAQEDAPEVLAPSGYFERLPRRLLGKLPGRPQRRALHPFAHPVLWSAAAALLLAVGAGAFWAGRANRTPLVEATLPRTPSEVQEVPADAPFHDQEDAVSQLTALSQQDAEAVLRTLSDRHGKPPAQQ